MRWILFGGVLLISVFSAAFLATFLPSDLPVPEAPAPSLHPADPPPEFKIMVLNTGHMVAKEAFAYRGGDLAEDFVFAVAAIVVDHPQGRFLFDAGFGSVAREHIQSVPPLVLTFSDHDVDEPAIQMLGPDYELDGIILSHLHWDHVSGIADYPDTPVWLSAEQRSFLESGHRSVGLASTLIDAANIRKFDYPAEARSGFERSFDLFGDGSVVLVPVSGHTPGSLAMLVALPSGRRFAFIGDLAWVEAGVRLPAERPWLARVVVDHDTDQVIDGLVHFHRLQKATELTIVPSHDGKVISRIANYPNWER
ncbi:MAG: MBL fold metallo-hydrolase [Xanthomonadales bacterium]|nr:MBL fold metallo-hydrolase [Xanthomonadales bacterium]